MISFRRLGLRSKVLMLLVGTTLLALVLACAGFVYLDQVTRSRDAREALDREARKLASQSSVYLDFGEPDELDAVLAMFFENPRFVAGTVYRADGSEFRSYRRPGASVVLPESVPDSTWRAPEDHYAVEMPVRNGRRTQGSVLLVRDRVDVRQRTREFVGVAAVMLALSFLAALSLSLRLQRHVTGPLLDLSAAATGVARRGDYAVRVEKENDDEIGELVEDFNEMLAQIQWRDAQLQEAHDTLEQKVAERTAELSATNKKLRGEIASRERIETALDQSQRKLYMHVRQTPLGVIDWNLEAQAVSWNPAAEKIFGWTEEEVIGRSWRDFLVPPHGLSRADRAWEALTSRTNGKQSILHNVTKDGRAIICEWFNTQLVDEKDQIVGVASMVQDISQRVRSEVALRESEERFAKAFQASPTAIGILTLEEGRFVDVNEHFLRLLGRPREEAVAVTDLELGMWTDEADRERVFRQADRERSVRDFECRLNACGQRVRTTLLSAERVMLGERKCVLLQVHDVTERMDLENQLRQSQKMEAIGQLAAGVAHDFNNILTIIRGHATLLSAAVPGEGEEGESVSEISAAADRAGNLTRQLLAFSRKQVMHARVVDLSDVVRDSAKMLGRLVGEAIRFETVPCPSVAPVEADVGMIEQVILNLAVNARDAMPKGGLLRVSVGRVLVDENEAALNPDAAAGAAVTLTVQDTGHGMDKATRARIFEPFFTTKEIGKGTGLGLATAYGIARQHHGWIEVDSEPDVGTTFHIYFPEAGGKPVDSGEEAAGRAPLDGHETILVVEDDSGLRRMVVRGLRRYGYRVYEAEHGPAAQEVWKQHAEEIDLMVTDMVMPGGLDGRELGRQLQGDRPELHVVYTSGYSEDLFVSAEGVNETCFLAKPYALTELTHVVRRELDAKSR